MLGLHEKLFRLLFLYSNSYFRRNGRCPVEWLPLNLYFLPLPRKFIKHPKNGGGGRGDDNRWLAYPI